MDDAYVESAAYILNSRGSTDFQTIDLRTSTPDHQMALESQIQSPPHYISHNSWFYSLPKSKILYSAPSAVREILEREETFEPTAGTAREGMKSFNNERFIRLWWEVSPSLIGKGNKWVCVAKGGEFSFYYSDISLLLNWSEGGSELQAVNQSINSSTAQVRQASDYWYLSGATYSKRSAKGFSARCLPAGCIFTSNGPAVLPNEKWTPAFILGWLNSKPVRALIHMQANFSDYSTGALKKLPWKIDFRSEDKAKLEAAIFDAIEKLRQDRAHIETSVCFQDISKSLVGGSEVCAEEVIQDAMKKWDLAVARSYGFDDLRWADETLNQEGESANNSSDHQEDDEANTDVISGASRALSYSFGCIFGRWDVRILLDPSLSPKLPEPFDSLPVCSPGMLVRASGLPAETGNIVSEEWLRARRDARTVPLEGMVKQPTIRDADYPLHISWDGILVDDPGVDGNQPHQNDIVRRVRDALDIAWKDKAHEIEQEACEILSVPNPRDYFRKPSGFFQDHLKIYSKSRRKAPIYWPVATASGSYTIWIYYHRLTEDTLYRIVSDYVGPKVSQVEDRLAQREAEQSSAEGRSAARLSKELSDLSAVLQELKDLRDELLRVAQLPYRPNLNDGVQITAAPLWRLFRLPRWRSELERTWKALERGKYDWAHLAYAIWPERVRETCRHDRSIAIAHNLEELYEEEESAPQRPARRGRGQAG